MLSPASSAIICVRGVMTSCAVFSLNSNTPSMSRASSLSRLPPSVLCSTSIRISSGEWSRSCSPGGAMPAHRSRRVAAPLSKAIGQAMSHPKAINGPATQRLSSSGWTRATALGTSSPRVMWRMVMRMKAIADATPWVAMADSGLGSHVNALPTRPASAGSPIQPRPSEARVIPSCVAEIERPSDCTARRASLALPSPALAISSRRVRRAPTSANSAATKNALAKTRTTTDRRPRPIAGEADGSIRYKCNAIKDLPRGPRMIRMLAVPPFEALDPLLPRRAGSDAATRETVRAILDDVLTRGDAAVREYGRRFDGVDLPPGEWPLDAGTWQGALSRVSPPIRAALERAVDRVRAYHGHQREPGFHLTEADGSLVGMKVIPLDRVGLYIPGGKASYPSSVVMNAVPALVAGVQEIVAVVPPAGVTDPVLAACALAGVTRIFRVGGAQAIAALAYGTATIPRVDKVVGPG